MVKIEIRDRLGRVLNPGDQIVLLKLDTNDFIYHGVYTIHTMDYYYPEGRWSMNLAHGSTTDLIQIEGYWVAYQTYIARHIMLKLSSDVPNMLTEREL